MFGVGVAAGDESGGKVLVLIKLSVDETAPGR